MLLGAAFPLMLQIILSVSFIGMTSSLTEDVALSAVMLSIGEALLIAAYIIFGRQNGITSVRKLVQHAKKRDMNTTDRQSLWGTGEYSPYKGFLIGFLSCVPCIIFQIINAIVPNSFCKFLMLYAFGWEFIPLSYAGVSEWLNLLMVLVPTAVHGGAYMFGAHKEWAKQQKVAALQKEGKSVNK